MSKHMKTIVAAVLLLLLGGWIGYHIEKKKIVIPKLVPSSLPGTSASSSAVSVARGAKLVLLGGCNDCHTTKLPNGQPDMKLMLSGYRARTPQPPAIPGVITANPELTAWRGPWGLSLSMNITPDKKTGIGRWTLAQFIHTMRTGVDPSGHALMPPMPYQTLGRLSHDDLAAMYNYLMSIRPIHNRVL